MDSTFLFNHWNEFQEMKDGKKMDGCKILVGNATHFPSVDLLHHCAKYSNDWGYKFMWPGFVSADTRTM
jgi:hypothetical protein